MKKHTEKTVTCKVCNQAKTMNEVLHAELVRPSVVETIRKNSLTGLTLAIFASMT